MNSHSSLALASSSHSHLSPPSFCWLEWFIHISNLASWWNVNNVCVPEGSWLVTAEYILSPRSSIPACHLYTWEWIKITSTKENELARTSVAASNCMGRFYCTSAGAQNIFLFQLTLSQMCRWCLPQSMAHWSALSAQCIRRQILCKSNILNKALKQHSS